MSENKGGNSGGTLGAVIITIIIAVFVFSGFSSCSGGSSNKSDIAYDPNGFLGYSDSFWEWYADNN